MKHLSIFTVLAAPAFALMVGCNQTGNNEKRKLQPNGNPYPVAEKSTVTQGKPQDAIPGYVTFADKLDSAKTELSKFRKEVDEFRGITWYYSNRFTHYTNSNKASLYLGITENQAFLRLMMSYTGDGWIFFEGAYFTHDGKPLQIFFDRYDNKKTDNSGGEVWEWIDVLVPSSDVDYFEALANSATAKMRLSGKYTKDRSLTASEKSAMKDILTAYKKLM